MTIYFYEWSNINGQPMVFTNNEKFIEFCNYCNIKITERTRKFLNDNDTVYITCKVGKNEPIMGGDKRNFRKNFSRHINNK